VTDLFRRGLRVLRQEGLRAFVLRFLDWAGIYRRLELVAHPLDVIRDIQSAVLVTTGQLEPQALSEYLAFRPDQDAKEIKNRFDRGDLCFAARHEGRIVSACWLMPNRAYAAYLDREFDVGMGLVFPHDGFTLPEYRRQKVIHRLGEHIARYLKENGYAGVVMAIHPSNVAALDGAAAGRFKIVGSVGFVRIGPWRRDFVRLRAN
jgi:GNAT superfamily N-acetyltransferase